MAAFLGRVLPPEFSSRTIMIPPGEALAYRPAEWHDALVVVERGRIDLETACGRHRFPSGAMLCLSGISLRAVRNPGPAVAVLVAITRKDPPMQRSPVLRRLDALIGEWEMAAEFGGVVFSGARTVFEWHEDGAFVVQRAFPGPLPPDVPASLVENSPLPVVTIIGLDDTAEAFTMLYSDARGVSRVYTMTLDGTEWTIHRAAPGFHQRFLGTLSDDGKTITARWEGSADGDTWKLDFPVTYTRVG
jgi:hypothetical protein